MSSTVESFEPAGTWDAQTKLKEGWVEFLTRRNFDAWGTVTFKVPTRSSGLAIRRTVRLLRRYYKGIGIRELSAFVVAEAHLSGSYHSHVLFKTGAVSDEHRIALLRSLWQMAFDRLGRAAFEPVSDDQGVRKYVAKYLVKRAGDWLMLGD